MRHEDDSILSAERLDGIDPLAGFRSEFVDDDPRLIYLDGNSLGRLTKSSFTAVERTMKEEWGKDLIRGWNKGWLGLSASLGKKVARIIGACEDEVIIADSTSVSLFKLAVAALRARPERKKILSDVLNFPSDLYILQSAAELLSDEYRFELVGSADGISIPIEDVVSKIDKETALVSLTHIAFKSSYMYDIGTVTTASREAGALVLWDLSHSAGIVPLELNANEVDMAVGCTYKYLNGGPGSPAFIYVRKELQEKLDQPIKGWFGCRRPFDFDLEYTPAYGMEKFQSGTPPVIGMASLVPALDVVLEAGIERIREKSVAQTEYLIFLFEKWLKDSGFSLGTPDDPRCRGSHVSLRHDEAFRICRALTSPSDKEKISVIPDFREPDNIRLGISPLYNSFTDIWIAVDRLRSIVKNGEFEEYSSERDGVT